MRAHAVLAILIAVAGATPGSAAPGDEGCQREVFMADAAVTTSYLKMERAGTKPEEQCAVWRGHVDVLRKSSATYGRCAVGAARGKVTELNASAADLQRLMAERCKGK